MMIFLNYFLLVSFAKIDRLLQDGRVPVIVGGTHYYIESLLWKVLLDDDPTGEQTDDDLLYERDRRRREVNDETFPTDDVVDDDDDDDQLLKTLSFNQDSPAHLSSARLHQLLKKIDPDMADTIHPNNRRKILR